MKRWPYIISATKVRQYIACERLPFMNAHRDESEAVDEAERLLDYDLGIRDEEFVAVRMRAGKLGPDVATAVRIPPKLGRAAAKLTLASMRAGDLSIEQGLLIHENWWGSPDHMVRRDGASALGDWHYEPRDVKAGGRKKSFRSQIVPVAFYALLLERIQGVRPARFTIYRKVRPTVDLWGQQPDVREVGYDVADQVAEVREIVDRLDGILGEGRDPGLHLTSECDKCKWRRACRADAERTRDLSLLTGLRRDVRPRLNALGIHTVDDLAEASEEVLASAVIVAGKVWLRQAYEQAKVYRDGRPRVIASPRLPVRATTEIYLDIEGEGLDNSTDAFLFGLLIRRGTRTTYWSALANSLTDVRRAWREFCKKIRTLPHGAPVYHFGTYDARLVKGLHERHGGARELLPRLVDLHAAFVGRVMMPTRGTGLKPLAQALGYRWKSPDATGRMSATWWHAWVQDRDRAARSKLIQYNKDDLNAMRLVLDWVRAEVVSAPTGGAVLTAAAPRLPHI